MLWATVVQVALNIVKSATPNALGTLQICMTVYDSKSDEQTVNCAKVSHVAFVTIILFPFSSIKDFQGCMIDDMKAPPQ